MADLFRKSILEKSASPDRLDETIKITSPFSWLALLGVLVIFVSVFLWSVYGTLPQVQTASGVIVSPGSTGVVYADDVADIKTIHKKVGDSVKKGDAIATVKTMEGREKKLTVKEDGVLTEIFLEKDGKVYAGTEAARYTPKTRETQLVLCYVPLAQAKQLREDMKVLIYPTSVDSQKNGHMEATIDRVEDYPAAASHLQYVLGVDNLVADQFLSQGPVVPVVCTLKTDSKSKNGYYWTSKNGWDQSVTNGTMVNARIVVKEEAPIRRLFHDKNEGMEG